MLISLAGFRQSAYFYIVSKNRKKMKRTDKPKWLEQFIYYAVWLVIFLAPLVGGLFVSYGSEIESFSWRAVRSAWLVTLPFFLLFVANNYLLAPRLLFRKKYWLYALSVITVIALLFVLYPYLGGHRPFGSFGGPEGERMERMFRSGERPDGFRNGEGRPFRNGFPEGEQTGDGVRPEDMPEGDTTPQSETGRRPRPDGHFRPDNGPKDFGPRFDGGPHREDFGRIPFPIPFISRLAMAFLLVGFNIGIKLLFKSLRDEERLRELEHESLQTELEYLKYQINPHFFMNTLNNIHALVDIDTEKAQKTILELSKMMRYVLYEANQRTISLSKEIQFLNNYIGLMKLRFTEKVDVQVSLPAGVPDVQIPPLLFISFVENAFKHGVSYQHESFVHIDMKVEEGELLFRCANSCFGKSDDQHHGIGLENICKRLRLLFGNSYTLSIDEQKDNFEVLLIIPLP